MVAATKKIFITLCLLWAASADAKDLCALYSTYTPLPSWYNDLCIRRGTGGPGSLGSTVGGAFSSFADSFNLNSASLPTMKIPIGAEMIFSAPTSGSNQSTKTNFTLIKSFTGLGFGVSTDNDNTIYSNRTNRGPPTITSTQSLYSSFANSNTAASPIPTTSLGAAISLERLLLQSAQQFLPQIGVLYRYNRDLKNWSPGFGLSYSLWKLSAGTSIITEQDAIGNKRTVNTQNVGIRLGAFQAEYVYISNKYLSSTSHATLITASAGISRVLFTGAMRTDSDLVGGTTTTTHFGAQFLVNPKIALAYFYNYIPGYHSLAGQFFL